MGARRVHTRRGPLLVAALAVAPLAVAWRAPAHTPARIALRPPARPLSFGGVPSTPRRRAVSTTEAPPEQQFTLMGADGKPVDLTLQEKERIFVDALQSYYYSGRQTLSDADFDLLKEDLMWEGSDYAMLDRNETLFLNAMAAYTRGEPILSDAEFDALKSSLKQQGSIVAVSKEPRCFVDTGVCSVTFQEDAFRKLVLYVPAALIGIALWAGGIYELVPASRSLNPLLSLVLGTPIIYAVAQALTEKILFVDPLIATGPCPNCGVNNRIFFGDILGVDGPGETADVSCTNCGIALTVDRATLRVKTVPKDEAA